jgi:hypothetical protein
MPIDKAIAEIQELLPNSTKGRVQIVHQGFMGGLRTYPDFPIELSFEQERLTAIFGGSATSGFGRHRGKDKKRGTIATFHGGQSHYESDDDGRSFPGKVKTSRSWETKNETAETDAKLYVLVRNNLEELVRLAAIGSKVEEATKANG